MLYPPLLEEDSVVPDVVSAQEIRILGPSAALVLFPNLVDDDVDNDKEEDGVCGGGGEFRWAFLPWPLPGDGERLVLTLEEFERLRDFSSSIASLSDARKDFIYLCCNDT